MNTKMNTGLKTSGPRLFAGFLSAAAMLAFSLIAVRPVCADQPYEGRVDAVRIAVWSLPAKDEIAALAPGDTLRLEPGEMVMLRLHAPARMNPTGQRQYLSAELSVERGPKHVTLTQNDPRKGSAVVTALNRGAGKMAVLRYRLLGKVEVGQKYMADATISVKIAPLPPPPPPSPPEVQIKRRGVTLYENTHFGGRSEIFYDGDTDLRNNLIGNDRASSIKVPPNCTVTLYGDGDYRGRSVTLHEDTADLGDTGIGNDAVSSLKVRCD